MTMSNGGGGGQFGDTTQTKVFVGGLAWETPKEALRQHFEKFGDILEAVIISDKLTGRSKGYGFVTFKEAEAAKKACEDGAPIINGRRANCNLASLGARRPKSAPPPPPLTNIPPPPQQVVHVGPTSAVAAPVASNMHWYYPAGTPATTPFHHQHHHHQAVPFYGYSPTYIATDHINYSHKLSYTRNGVYMNGNYNQIYPGQAMLGASSNTMMPMYPLYHFQQSQTMGLPAAHFFTPSNHVGPITSLPATIISKPASIAPPPPSTTGTVGRGEGFIKKVG